MRLDQMSGYLAFLAVARRESFTTAAAELDVSRSAISQAVAHLEKKVGVPLFLRTTRSVRLTDAGRTLFEKIAPAMRDIQNAASELAEHGERPFGLLRINTPRIADNLVLRPLLPAFLRAYPDVEVEIYQDDSFIDIVAQGFDAGVRLGEATDRDMVVTKLGSDLAAAVVASPAYLKKRGVPKTLDDLKGHDCVRHRHSGSGTLYRWEFERRGKDVNVEVRGRLIVNESSAAIAAALDGLGLAYTVDAAVQRHVAAGSLRHVLDEFCPRFPGFHLYYPSRRQMPAKLRAFVDFLRARSQT